MKKIFALDYGRGTMAGFWCDPLHVELFKPLMDRNGEPSGFARMKDGSYRLGKELYSMGSAVFRKTEKLYLNVKDLPNGDDSLQIEYARAWLNRIKKNNPNLFRDDGEEIWIIGCPTAKEWRHKNVVEQYKNIFEKAGFKNVIIVPESNAALMCLERQYGLLEKWNKTVGVLCIDLGAYSSDSTYITPGKVQSVGGYIGASLIERMILAKNLEGVLGQQKKYRNAPEIRRLVAERCKADSYFANYLLIHAKKLKETYFTALITGADYSNMDCIEAVDIRGIDERIDDMGVEEFTLVVNDPMIHVITKEESVKSVLGQGFNELSSEVRAYLGDKTWIGCLVDFIKTTMKSFPAFAHAAKNNTGETASLALTGGASLMPFVEETLTELLPYAQVYRDTEPMSTIAKGLLFFGPDKVKFLDLMEHLRYLMAHDADGNDVEGRDSILNICASEAHNTLGLRMIRNTMTNMVNSLVDQTVRWQSREIKSNSIVPNARANFKSWFDYSMHEEYLDSINETKDFLVTELNKLYKPLLDRLQFNKDLLTRDDFSLEYASALFDWWKNFYQIFDGQIEEEECIYADLPNPGLIGGFFGTSREEYLNGIAQKLDERNNQWIEKVLEDAVKLFDSPEVYGPFIDNLLDEIILTIDKRTKTIRHDLLLEESFDDEE